MKQRLLTLVAFLFIIGSTQAQDRNCAAHEIHEQKLANNPEYAQNYANIEDHTRQFIQNYDGTRVSGSQVIIPCIVHVVYANSQENISDAQVQSQIDRLNEDFSATNSDYNQVPSTFTSVRSGDTQIRFELIEIRREANSRDTWGTNDAVKSAYPPVEPARILNMWVADIGGGILGYAQFPGGSSATDGVVMSPQYFGDATKGSGFYLSAPFNRGRTATHEVGHWLNLRHIWGDGNCSRDDFVSDTPVAGNPNYGCPSAGTNSCSGGLSDMFMNYMDYVDDACMFMFSAGQDARMQATFANGGGREGFLLDPVYTPGGGSGGGGGGTTCDDTEVTLTLVTDNYGSETSWSLTSGGSTIASGSGYGNNQTISETFCLADGDYTFTINDSYGDGICCAYGNGSYSVSDGSSTLASGGSFASSESTNFTIGGGGTPTNNAPTADAGGSYSGDEGSAISFNGSGSSDPDGDALSYSWSFSDGGSATGANASYTFASAGSYTATLTVSDGNGGSDSDVANVTVNSVGGGGGGGNQVIFQDFFESGFGNWNDGGSDCARYTGGTYSYEGSASIRIRDNSGTASSMTTDTFNASSFNSLEVEFYFYPLGMENGEDFWLQYSSNGGSSWTTIATYAAGTNFNNNTFYTATVPITGSLSSNSRLRFRNDASVNNDQVYIDQVTVTGLSAARLAGPSISEVTRQNIKEVPGLDIAAETGVNVYPNPASGKAFLRFTLDTEQSVSVKLYDMQGKLISLDNFDAQSGAFDKELSLNGLRPGLYFVNVTTGDGFKKSMKLQVR